MTDTRLQKQSRRILKASLVATILFSLLSTFLFSSFISASYHQMMERIPTSPRSSRISEKDSIVYQTEALVIRRLSNHIYQHISYLKTTDFGNVSCNGMLVVNEGEGIIFDTPASDSSSAELLRFAKNIKCNIKAVISTHFHADCIAGLRVFRKQNISCYALSKTIEQLKANGNDLFRMLTAFDSSLMLSVGSKMVSAEYFGEGHTRDNIVGYFSDDRAVFGGCLIKEIGANKGNLGDANVNEWAKTVRKIRNKYKDAQIVIPGHGKPGGIALFDYTIKLFEINANSNQ